ncbi:MAG: hypothetical protein OMM_00063 [Candidatus Magnetoglobus multicellularis str. Araruama]|uniref:Uncharacterized protein n=1 Tax=Candidatus Magnetoglobus multicellularis str. Araruama TaxID=890399 RepID=A0A1V1PIA4_9BACT|nr:MAG: hypothetical protein OMM_00063 [Candidatus Magnetoglobus multicellularis str. Araruama]
MSRIRWIFFMLAVLFVASPSMAANLAFHGDMNHRFMLYSNHLDWFKGQRPSALHHGNVEDSFAEVKYRLWTEAETNEGKVKGVYAIEMGGLRFGASGSLGKGTGGTYSGDSVNIETRWAYIDFQVPFVPNKSRIKIGLQPFKLNARLWSETILGVNYTEKVGGLFTYQVAWLRTHDERNWNNEQMNTDDIDFLTARYDISLFGNKFKGAVFGLYGFNDDAGEMNPGMIQSSKYQVKKFSKETGLRLWCVGSDGGIKLPMTLPIVNEISLFANWDTIFQFGKIKNARFYDNVINPEKLVQTDTNGNKYHAEGDFDIYAFTAHLNAGVNVGPAKLTYTGWYTSGDRDATDDSFNGYMAIDMDAEDSIVLFEGNYADDIAFTDAHYILDKGFIMNKVAADYQVLDTLKVGVAGLYMMTAKAMEYNDPVTDELYSARSIGYEVDTYAKLNLYPNLEFAVNGGYLFSGNGMDVFEEDAIRNGVADENIYIIASRVRYKF